MALAGAAVLCPAAARAGGVETLSGSAFGTGWRVVAPGGAGLGVLGPAIAALFAEVDRQMSPWRRDSAISRVNAGGAGAHPVPPETGEVVRGALALAGASGGRFDPTVGPLVARWGFGPIAEGAAPDWRGLSVAGGRVVKARDGLTLDPCGIAKGWALDRAAELIRAAGLRDFLFDLGGEVLAAGRHPDGRAWRVAVESPVPGAPSPAILALPGGSAVATSGTRAQSYAAGGRLYGHVIDPGTGEPVAGRLRAVTVLAASGMLADGWATALFAAGEPHGPELARAAGCDALFLIDGETGLRAVRTGALAAFEL